MPRNLESRILPFRSRSEYRIASFLQYMDISYRYEAPVAVTDRGLQRVWYPDFHLPDFGTYLEFFGVTRDSQYHERTQHKLRTYERNGISVIPMYAQTLRGQWRSYVVDRLYRIEKERTSRLQRLPYNRVMRYR